MNSSIDPIYDRRLRLLFRRDFTFKKIQTLNDELDSTYSQMKDSVEKKALMYGMITGGGIGYYYGAHVIPAWGKGHYVRKTIFWICAISISNAVKGISARYLYNYGLETKMIERYEAQVLQNHPMLKGNQGGQNPQGGFYMGSSQSPQASAYQNNQNLNWEASNNQNLGKENAGDRQVEGWNASSYIENPNFQNPRDLAWEASKSQNLGKQDIGNRQIENWNSPSYIENPNYQNSQNLVRNQGARPQSQFPDYSKPQADWNSQNNWNKENSYTRDYVNPNSSKYDSFGSRMPPSYTDDLRNQNNHYPGDSNEDKSSVSYYPGVSPPHESTPNPRHY